MSQSEIKIIEDRLSWIDGLKGIFSILVVFCHLALAFAPGLWDIAKAETDLQRIWVNTPLNVITNGNTAVQFFFFASGLLIARNVCLKQENKPLYKKYTSLFHVTIPAILFSWILMKLGLMFHLDAVALNTKLEGLEEFNNFIPSFAKCLFEIFVGVFIDESSYVGPLWTIRYEILGSIITYPLAHYIYSNKQRGIYTYAFVAVLLIRVKYDLVAFMLGAAIWDLMAYKDNGDILSNVVSYIEKHWIIKFSIFVIGFYLACCNMQLSGMYAIFSTIGYGTIIRAIGIALCVFVLFISPKMQNILAMKPLVKLGEISAYIYAFHWQIILSVGCALFLMLYKRISYDESVIICSIVCIIMTILVAYLYRTCQKFVKRYYKKSRGGR